MENPPKRQRVDVLETDDDLPDIDFTCASLITSTPLPHWITCQVQSVFAGQVAIEARLGAYNLAFCSDARACAHAHSVLLKPPEGVVDARSWFMVERAKWGQVQALPFPGGFDPCVDDWCRKVLVNSWDRESARPLLNERVVAEPTCYIYDVTYGSFETLKLVECKDKGMSVCTVEHDEHLGELIISPFGEDRVKLNVKSTLPLAIKNGLYFMAQRKFVGYKFRINDDAVKAALEIEGGDYIASRR